MMLKSLFKRTIKFSMLLSLITVSAQHLQAQTPCPPYPPPASPTTCDSNGLLINGSFEDKVVSTIYAMVQQPGWKNLSENNGVIETWISGAWGVPAADGRQFVEVNGSSLGILAQDVTVTPNIPITLSYYHRSRGATPGEKVRIEIVDLTTGQTIHTFESTSTTSWTQFNTSFTPTSPNIELRVVSLNTCSGGGAACGNFVDGFKMQYSACNCPNLPIAPVICVPSTVLCSGASATITTQGCAGGTIHWNNGQTGATLTTDTPGTYYAQCIMPGTTCQQSPISNTITLTTSTTPAAPTVSRGNTSCPSEMATLTAAGCASGTIKWSNGTTGSTISASPGTYTATCTDAGCESPASAPIEVKPCPACPSSGNLIKNGSFENPVVTDPHLWDLVTVPNWTNLKDNNEIELQRNKYAPASAGKQYAELNGYTYGEIYQDIPVSMNATSMNWSLDHRAREINSSEKIQIIVSAPDGSNAQTVEHTAHTNFWATISGTYPLAPGQTTVRIKIISLGGINPTNGNFIDNVKANYVGCATANRSTNNMEATEKMGLRFTALPNPIVTNATLALEGFDNGAVSIEIISANGSVSKSIVMNYINGSKLNLDMSSYESGMYFIRILQNGNTAAIKIVKE